MSDSQYNDSPRRPLWPMLVAFGSVGAIVLTCGGVFFIASRAGSSRPIGRDSNGEGNPPGASPARPVAYTAATPMHSGGWLSKEEETVKAFILDSASDPKSIEFSRWGPNIRGEDFLAVMDEVNGRQTDKLKAAAAREQAQSAAEDKERANNSFPPAIPNTSNPRGEFMGVPLRGGELVRVRYRGATAVGGKRLADEGFIV